MSRLTGGALVARALGAEGVKQVFSLSGNHILSVYDACLSQGIRIVDTRHEAAAAHMADAWARLTGQPGVCLVTAGPGHTNALTGVATAYGAGSPVILLSGNSEAEHFEMGAMQELDQVALAAPVTKWARLATDVRQIPRLVSSAFRQAMAGRPGPVHLSLPSDLLDQTVDEAELDLPRPAVGGAVPAFADPKAIEETIALLVEAERPVVIAGSGAWWAKAGEALAEFVAITELPVFTIGMARGLISDDDPHCLGYADPVLNAAARQIGRADVVLVLGKRMDFRIGFGRPPYFDPLARIIQVDVSAAEIGRNRAVSPGMVADVAAATGQLVAAARQRVWRTLPWLAELQEVRKRQEEEWAPAMASDEEPIHPLRLVAEVRNFARPETIVAIDGGDFVQFARAALKARRPGRWLRLGPLSTLGCAVPFAIAAKLAHPEDDVLAITGDGALGFYAMEFDTAVRHELPFVAVVANDASWCIEKQLQTGLYGADRVVGTDLRFTRYDQMVAALGGHGEFVTAAADIAGALQRAKDSGRPACVNVATTCLRSPLTEAYLRRKMGQSD